MAATILVHLWPQTDRLLIEMLLCALIIICRGFMELFHLEAFMCSQFNWIT